MVSMFLMFRRGLRVLCRVLWCWLKVLWIICLSSFGLCVGWGGLVKGVRWMMVELILGGGLNVLGLMLNRCFI